jgi:hypothetical protein
MGVKRGASEADGSPTVASRIDYDSQVIERFAHSLYRRAAAASKVSLVVGAFLGGVFGGMPLTSLSAHWPVPHALGYFTLLGAAVAGGYLGHLVGEARAFGYKLQAQSALCQVEIQRNTAAAVRAALVSAAATAPEAERVLANGG